MTALYIQHVDGVPVLYIDGDPVAPDARVTMDAANLARAMDTYLQIGSTVVAAPVVTVNTPDRIAITSLPARQTARRVNRNVAGDITDTLDVEEDIP